MSTITETPVREGSTESGIHVRQVGHGPDVLLIGGLTDVIESWQPQLDGLSDRYRVTTYDNRGFGQTTMPAPTEPYTMATMTADAVEVLDHLGIERAHVGGFSGGGMVAQHLAIGHPERVRSLVLNGTADYFDAHARRFMAMWRRMVERATDDRSFLEDFLVFIYSPAAHESGWVDEAIEEMLAYPHAPAPQAIERSIDAYADHDARAGLGGIAVPTLVLAGEYDLGAPPRVVRRLADQIPGAIFEVLPGAGHQQFQEQPELWNGKVDAFWRGLG